MKKTAVVYDKWLHSLGGGEVVACSIAKILKEQGYEVTFICGKKVPLYQIEKRINVNLKGIKFIEVWNDEIKLKKIVEGKDLFVNTSFMDYSFGYAKKNIYYTHFPTEPYVNLKGKIFTEFILPLASKLIKPMEFIEKPAGKEVKNGRLVYLIEKPVKLAFSYLKVNRIYLLKFSIFFENFYSSLLESFRYEIEEGEVLDRKTEVDSHYNVVHFYLKVKPLAQTIYLKIISNIKSSRKPHSFPRDKVYLLYPKIFTLKLSEFVNKLIYEKIVARLRAGIFINILERLKSYDLILANSEFTKKWIKTYWKRDAIVLYPPVDLLFEKYDLSKVKKENWICNVGRFFTLGHGKRQEVLVEAFKKLYDKGYTDWQLHLVGGVGDEPSSQNFVKYLRKQAKGYPIFFHFNATREELEQVLLKSKIYWHATGYGEDESKRPIKFEHFGIAPIEAISAGCVPFLYEGGGSREVIEALELPQIHLFSTTEELVKNTSRVIAQIGRYVHDIFLRKNLLKKTFSIKSFYDKWKKIV